MDVKIDIKKIRKELGLTQLEFAIKLGVTPATVNRWERGRNLPSKLAIAKIKSILNQGEQK
jgi:DNA-binding transcriptional regulator YiaG